jgi:hypothetical protein
MFLFKNAINILKDINKYMMIIQSNSIYYLPRENIYLDYKSERRMDPMIELLWLIETLQKNETESPQ